MKKLKIGIAGTRGIPNTYGGFEQFAQHLAPALVSKGHHVTVYNSHLHPYKGGEWKGVQIVKCKDPEHRIGTAGQFIYDRHCILDARKKDFDILLHLGYTSSSVWWRKWPKQSINIVNMDGLEWLRPKYSFFVKRFLKRAEAWAAKHADHLIADSIPIKERLLQRYRKTATYIPYGAELFDSPDPKTLHAFNLFPFRYYLVIARIEPDNSIETIIKGWLDVANDSRKKDQPVYPLIIIGRTEMKYGRKMMRRYQHDHLRFAGSIYDKFTLDNLRHFSAKYFHGHCAGGTNPSLLEAMASNADIACHDNVFNRAVTGVHADYFSKPADVKTLITNEMDENTRNQRRYANREKIKTDYNWQDVISAYENRMLELYEDRHSAGNR
jgi:glycosyltransferase involved in cell wall biosynthesis